jgi:glycine oxidase
MGMMEVVVVGGGIAGASVALELAGRGVAVNLIDAERPGGAATGASAGMLAPQYEADPRTPLFGLLLEARSFFGGFADRVEDLSRQDLHLRWDGMLVANGTDRERVEAEESARLQRAMGHRVDVLDSAEAARLQPGLDPAVPSWVWLPAEGQVDSQALAVALPAALAATDVRVISGRKVAEIRSEADRVRGVRLGDGRTLAADGVVVAAGAWSGGIHGLPRPLHVGPVRGHILRFPGTTPPLRRLVATHAGRYLVPRDDGTILAGSTMDEVGFDRSLSEAGMASVHRSAAALVPRLGDAQPIERWADLRPMSVDRLPVLGPDPDIDGLFYATGYGRNGILLGPLAGRIVADLIVSGSTEHNWRPFGVRRFIGAQDRPDPPVPG